MSRVAFVTGAASGIGRAIAVSLAAAGHRVVVADLNRQGAEAVADEIRAAGGEAVAVGVDITSGDSVTAAIAEAERALGPVEVLVNCAGWDDFMNFVDTDEAFWQKVVQLNYVGMLRVTHAVVPGMIERGWGRVVNIGSDAGRVGSSLEAVYSGAKGATIAFTKTLAREVATSGITANTVCPGPTDTPALRKFADSSGADADKVIGGMTRAVPMKRLGAPDDVAAAVRFFASEDTSFITGQTLSVSGGLTMA
jgi:2-hydroxycyclohexanecarboxyl-CoA dehydrogenase